MLTSVGARIQQTETRNHTEEVSLTATLPPFARECPASAADAVRLRDEAYSSCYFAGGTHLIPHWRTQSKPPDLVINIRGVADWSRPVGSDLWIDPTMTVSQLKAVLPARPAYAGLAAAAGEFGSPLVEPLATVCGNLAAARSDSTFAGPLISLDAIVRYLAVTGPGQVAAVDLIDKPGETTLPHGALITGIAIPAPTECARGGHLALRVGTAAQAPTVAASAVVEVADDGTLLGGRLTLSNAAPTPREVIVAREIFESGRHWTALVSDLGDAAVDAADPDSDRWASARYRQRMIRVVTERLIRQIATGSQDR